MLISTAYRSKQLVPSAVKRPLERVRIDFLVLLALWLVCKIHLYWCLFDLKYGQRLAIWTWFHVCRKPGNGGIRTRSGFLCRVRWTQTQILQGCSLLLPSRKDYTEFCIFFKVNPVFCVCGKKSISRINSRWFKSCSFKSAVVSEISGVINASSL